MIQQPYPSSFTPAKNMKRFHNLLTWILVVLVNSLSHGNAPHVGHELVFHIKGAKEKPVYLGYFYGTRIQYVDTSHFDASGKVVFKGQQALLEGMYVLQFEQYTLDFVVAEQRFTLHTALPQLEKNAKVHGSRENELYMGYKKFILQQKQTVDSLRQLIRKGQQEERILPQIDRVNRSVQQYRATLFAQSESSLAIKIIKAGIEVKAPRQIHDSLGRSRQLKERMFDHIDWSEEALIRTPYLQERITKYMQLTTWHPDSLAHAATQVLAKAHANRTLYRYTLTYLLEWAEQSNKPWMDVLYTYLAQRYFLGKGNWWADSTQLLTVRANIARMAPLLTGKVAPPIDFMDTLSRPLPLHGVQSRYTILYFWDADCSHCQETTPKLWEYYQQVHPKGVEVYAVTIQQVYYSWQAYLRKHKPTWYSVWEPTKIAEVYKTYQIATTPAIYLLDEEKRILCKKINLEELKAYLGVLL